MRILNWLHGFRQKLSRSTRPTYRTRPRRRRSFQSPITCIAGIESLEPRTLLSAVTTTADSGTGSLRQAILDVDASAGPQTITFAIPGGPATIDLLSALPDLTGTITIQGPRAADVTVERSSAAGTAQFSIFQVDSGAIADIFSLTIAKGDSSFEGG